MGCIRHALQELGHDPNKHSNLERFIGPPLLQSFAELLGSQSDAETALVLYRERFSTVGLYENKVYPDIEATLKALSARGYRMFVATSKPGIYAAKIIDHFGLSTYFSSVHGSELDGRRTDKSELIAYLLDQEGLEKAETQMIGDRSYDMVGAKNNDLRAVGVLWGYGGSNELKGAGADALCTSPTDLITCLT